MQFLEYCAVSMTSLAVTSLSAMNRFGMNSVWRWSMTYGRDPFSHITSNPLKILASLYMSETCLQFLICILFPFGEKYGYRSFPGSWKFLKSSVTLRIWVNSCRQKGFLQK
ncbi:hypothetical protein BY458DRAFT_519069 [Sporodiniella umbellata]|nr:hypothetical protein BY458DRAFT_519069 [Sporodiniella umbellata]